jgi:hypothetical protein
MKEHVEWIVRVNGRCSELGIAYTNACVGCLWNDNNKHCGTKEFKLKRAKEWLKERENNMIDLSKNQIVEPPIKCWMRNRHRSWEEDLLYSIDHRDNNAYPFRSRCSSFNFCSLIDPNKPKIKKWERVEDVPVELWGKALFKAKAKNISNVDILTPFNVTDAQGNMLKDLVYLPLGQPLTGEWLPFESEAKE